MIVSAVTKAGGNTHYHEAEHHSAEEVVEAVRDILTDPPEGLDTIEIAYAEREIQP